MVCTVILHTHTHIQYIAYNYIACKNTFVSRNSMEPMNYMKPQVCMHTHTHTQCDTLTHTHTYIRTHCDILTHTL